MKKVCFFVGGLANSGGTERVSTIIINKLASYSSRYEIHIVSLDTREPVFTLDPSVQLTAVESEGKTKLKRISNSVFQLRSYLKENSIDTLVAVESMLTLYAVPACTFLNTKLVVWEHFNFSVSLGRKFRVLARYLAAFFADDVVTLTRRDKEVWEKRAWCRANIVAISNPVILDVAKSNPSINNKTFLAVGRLSYQKGFDDLIDAWSMVIESYPDWTLNIVGDGEERDSLEQKIKALALEKSVQLVGPTKDVERFYLSSTFYVMSSRFEGLPMVLLEAITYGLPIVSYDCDTGPAEIIEHERNGWLCKVGNINALAEIMKLSIKTSENKTEYYEMSKNSKQKSRQFSLAETIDKWCSIL